MKRKNKLRVLEILCIISLLFTIFSIRRTYARYFEKVDTTYQTHIKRWLIKINDLNIHEAKSLSEVVQPVLVENENMNNNNTLVPGRTGYFDMMIDYTYVDLAFKYEFSIEQLNETQLKDFEIYGYEIVDGDKSTVTETKQIKGVIDPDKDLNSANEKKRDIRILFRWNDGDGSIMDNKLDTQYRSEENEALNYRATLKFTQYIESENP
ncbi:unknown [Clostridium sp. CAG:356]|jgi:hypothetical protein|nr:MAG: hypothetical protein BHW02_04385 [Clostridium sp. 28_12]CDD37114.1 unknown [Clostridium sp. CAG:356]